MGMILLSAALKCQTEGWATKGVNYQAFNHPCLMGITGPTLLTEETTINLHFWHGHCSPTITTTCSTHGSSSDSFIKRTRCPASVSPPFLLGTNANITTQYMCSSTHHIYMQAQSLDIFGCIRNKNHTQDGPHMFQHSVSYQISVRAEWNCQLPAGRFQHICIMSMKMRKMEQFLLPEKEFLTSCKALVFFRSEIWVEGQVKRPFSLG